MYKIAHWNLAFVGVFCWFVGCKPTKARSSPFFYFYRTVVIINIIIFNFGRCWLQTNNDKGNA